MENMTGGCVLLQVPFRIEKHLSHYRKTESWCLLGVLSNISDDHPRPFYVGVPPGPANADVFLNFPLPLVSAETRQAKTSRLHWQLESTIAVTIRKL